MCEKTTGFLAGKHFLLFSCNDEQDKTGSGCHQDVLKAVLEARPDSAFVQSLLFQYQERGD